MEDPVEPKADPLRAEVATLANLLVGEEVCDRKPWYELRHPEEAPRPGPGELRSKLNQVDILTRLVPSLHGGYLARNVAIAGDAPGLTGTVDLIHSLPEEVNLYLVKREKPSRAHELQVLILIHLERRGHPELAGARIQGHLVYPAGETTLGEAEIPRDLEDLLEPHIHSILGRKRPRPIYSSVCETCWAYCPLAKGRDSAPRVC